MRKIEENATRDDKDYWINLGVVGVDSGKLLITDPCYIDNEWKQKDFEDIRRHRNKSGKIFEYLKDFDHYESSIEEHDGKTPNELLSSGEWIDVPVLEKTMLIGDYSYAGCCETRGGELEDGQLNFSGGHPGAGVVFTSGLGDGLYTVSAKIGIVKGLEIAGKRIKEVKIKLI